MKIIKNLCNGVLFKQEVCEFKEPCELFCLKPLLFWEICKQDKTKQKYGGGGTIILL